MKINILHSPNYSNRERLKKSIKFIILHYTGMQSERACVKKLIDKKSKVSTHYLISTMGSITRMVSDQNTAWHAGKSKWKNFINLNDQSIGIELVNRGHQFGYENFSKKQISKLLLLKSLFLILFLLMLCQFPIFLFDKKCQGNFSPGSSFLKGAMSE